jgi:hypothetical protein
MALDCIVCYGGAKFNISPNFGVRGGATTNTRWNRRLNLWVIAVIVTETVRPSEGGRYNNSWACSGLGLGIGFSPAYSYLPWR